jgi:hypothetical protein
MHSELSGRHHFCYANFEYGMPGDGGRERIFQKERDSMNTDLRQRTSDVMSRLTQLRDSL